MSVIPPPPPPSGALRTMTAPPSRTWWTKPKVSAVSVVAGLVLGVGIGASGQQEESSPSTGAEADMSASHIADLESQVDQLQADQQQVVDAALAQQQVQHEQETAAAVEAAKAEVEAAAAEPVPLVAPAPAAPASTDPHYGTCGEANAHGYGDYVRGIDPEYDWYQDRDGDGVVCEQ